MNDKKLWTWFSVYIRLRDASHGGICRCFTCGRIAEWTKMDCGHGVGRQHKATKFHEQNNHAQCKRCNGFEEGRKDVYCKQVDKLYGFGTWDKLLILSRSTVKRTQFEIDALTEYYKLKAKEMAKDKGVKIK